MGKRAGCVRPVQFGVFASLSRRWRSELIVFILFSQRGEDRWVDPWMESKVTDGELEGWVINTR